MSKCAVILAGGKGSRLRPYSISIPKPLVPIGEVPILELVIKKLEREGFKKIIITVNHLAELIQAFFGDGSKWGVEIEYSLESRPLSTMGPLKLIKNLPDNFLILNGDVLTDLNFSDLFNSHIENKNIFTVSAHQRVEKIDYGVLELDENESLINFREKPNYSFMVSMGVYVANKEVLRYIPYNEYFGFDNLMLKLIELERPARVFKYDGYWLDIGRPDDYEKAINDIDGLKI